jgi:hypothetical protein
LGDAPCTPSSCPAGAAPGPDGAAPAAGPRGPEFERSHARIVEYIALELAHAVVLEELTKQKIKTNNLLIVFAGVVLQGFL